MSGNKFRFTICALGLIIGGIIMLTSFISESIAVSKGMDDFNDLKEDEFKKGRFVQGTVQALDFEFAEEWEERTGSKEKENRKKYFLIPLQAHENEDEVKYIAVCFTKESDMQRADILIDQCLEYYNSGEEPISFSTFEITGKVGTLSKKMEGYMYDTLIKYEWGKTQEECKQYVCDYCIFCKEPPSIVQLFIGVGLVIIGAVVIFFIFIRSRRYGQ